MYQAEIKGYLGADFRFRSNSFKWCYYSALHFARQAVYIHEFVQPIIIRLTGDILIAVSSNGMVIDTPERVMEVYKNEVLMWEGNRYVSDY